MQQCINEENTKNREDRENNKGKASLANVIKGNNNKQIGINRKDILATDKEKQPTLQNYRLEKYELLPDKGTTG